MKNSVFFLNCHLPIKLEFNILFLFQAFTFRIERDIIKEIILKVPCLFINSPRLEFWRPIMKVCGIEWNVTYGCTWFQSAGQENRGLKKYFGYLTRYGFMFCLKVFFLFFSGYLNVSLNTLLIKCKWWMSFPISFFFLLSPEAYSVLLVKNILIKAKSNFHRKFHKGCHWKKNRLLYKI